MMKTNFSLRSLFSKTWFDGETVEVLENVNERFDKNIDTKTKLVTENDVANKAVTTSSTNDAVCAYV